MPIVAYRSKPAIGGWISCECPKRSGGGRSIPTITVAPAKAGAAIPLSRQRRNRPAAAPAFAGATSFFGRFPPFVMPIPRPAPRCRARPNAAAKMSLSYIIPPCRPLPHGVFLWINPSVAHRRHPASAAATTARKETKEGGRNVTFVTFGIMLRAMTAPGIRNPARPNRAGTMGGATGRSHIDSPVPIHHISFN